MNYASHYYMTLLGIARRHARRSHEAEDIVQEVLLAAFSAGRADMSVPANRNWMAGAIRKRAAFDARSAARRSSREARWQAEASDGAPRDAEALVSTLSGLPRSLRVVAALALSGHTRREIAYLLALTDTALRQRIAALKKALKRRGDALPEGLPGLNHDLPYGRIRQELQPHLRRQRGAFASHDPDGHFFVIRRSQTP